MKALTLLIPAILFSACGGSSSYPVPEPMELTPTSTPSLVPSPPITQSCEVEMTEELKQAIKQLKNFLKDADMYRNSHKKPVVLVKDEEALKVLLNYFESKDNETLQ